MDQHHAAVLIVDNKTLCLYSAGWQNVKFAIGSHPMARRSLTLVICALAALLDFRVSFAGEEPKSSPTVVRVWQGLGGEIGTAIQAQVDRFNAAHPDIHVEVTVRNGYSNTLKDFRDAVAAGDPPEVAVIEVHSVTTLASTGETASLDELIKRDKQFDLDDLLPATLLNLHWKGRLYGLPVTRSTPVLYYNKRRFVAAGLDPDKPPQTWGEFREAARKLTTDAERSYGYRARRQC
jgi:ABC-type glycerol-3-phosphate transport system substrate-binding protein